MFGRVRSSVTDYSNRRAAFNRDGQRPHASRYNAVMNRPPDAVVLVSADAEWQSVGEHFGDVVPGATPFGETLDVIVRGGRRDYSVVLFHGGWGKIAAAASTQYAVDRWRPPLLLNLGTCGGFAGDIAQGTVLLVNYTLVYDVLELMGDPDEALAYYTTELDLSRLRGRLPLAVRQEMLLSADRDIVAAEVEDLRARFGAVAADWESGAIAWVAARNEVPCLILRAVTDLVDAGGGEAYGRPELFAARTAEVMGRLLDSLPGWLDAAV